MDPRLLQLLHDDLVAANYTESRLSAWLTPDVHDLVLRGVFGPAHDMHRSRCAADPDARAFGILVALFVLGETLRAEDLDVALPSLSASGAHKLGLVAREETAGFRAALSLSVHDRWWILSDLDDHLRTGAAHPDHVMGVGRATRSLLDAVPHRRVDRALEVGTGCGLVALELSQIARHVTATDISERALNFARANLRLNGVTNVELRRGDMFEPVQGQVFDLIVSNPPFVISPATDGHHHVYRSSGEAGDALVRRMLEAAPAHLRPEATLVCLVNWELSTDDEEGGGVLRRLIREAGTTCSAWLIERARQTPLEYSSLWLRDGGLRETDENYDEELRMWIADFARRRISCIGFGYLAVRNTPRAPSLRAERVSGALGETERFGDAWATAYDEWIKAEALTDGQLLDSRFVLQPGVEEVRVMRPGTEEITSISFVRRTGIERFQAVDTFTSALLGACDGDLSAGEIAEALAELLEVDPPQARHEAANTVREFVAMGMLLPFEG